MKTRFLIKNSLDKKVKSKGFKIVNIILCIFIVGIILALLSIVSIILLKVSNKEYPETEEQKTPKFEVGKISHPHCSDPVETEKPKKKRRKYHKNWLNFR